LAVDAASAQSVPPVLVPGNPDCTDIGYSNDFAFKIDGGPFDGTHDIMIDGDNVGQVTIHNPAVSGGDDHYFTWEATLEMFAVIVKGGPNANVYHYDPLATEDMVLPGLVPPTNSDDGEPYDISHIDFCTDSPVPVELTSFTSQVNGTNVALNWETTSETNNAGFEVQVQDGEHWTVLSFVDGHGTTTEAQTYSYTADMGVGTHTFRLKQIDFDGAFEYSGEIEVEVQTPGSHVLSAAYPNPFNPQSQFTLAVAQDQIVTAELFNTLGQRVVTLFSGTVEANQAQRITIDGKGLASGMYVVRVIGERFSDAINVTLLK
jgi:hypothetical protein